MNTDKKVTAKYIVLVVAVLGISPMLYAQRVTIATDSAKKTVDFSGNANNAEIQLPSVEKRPEFPGGKKAWQDFLRQNINISVPFSNKALPGNYTVMIRFIVGNNGKLTEIGADSNCGYGMESEVIRCIQNSADWIPAETTSGKKVRFILRQQVNFQVTKNDIVIAFPKVP